MKQNFTAAAALANSQAPTTSRRDRLVLAQIDATLGSLAGTPSAAALADAAGVLELLEAQHTATPFALSVRARLDELATRLA